MMPDNTKVKASETSDWKAVSLPFECGNVTLRENGAFQLGVSEPGSHSVFAQDCALDDIVWGDSRISKTAGAGHELQIQTTQKTWIVRFNQDTWFLKTTSHESANVLASDDTTPIDWKCLRAVRRERFKSTSSCSDLVAREHTNTVHDTRPILEIAGAFVQAFEKSGLKGEILRPSESFFEQTPTRCYLIVISRLFGDVVLRQTVDFGKLGNSLTYNVLQDAQLYWTWGNFIRRFLRRGVGVFAWAAFCGLIWYTQAFWSRRIWTFLAVGYGLVMWITFDNIVATYQHLKFPPWERFRLWKRDVTDNSLYFCGVAVVVFLFFFGSVLTAAIAGLALLTADWLYASARRLDFPQDTLAKPHEADFEGYWRNFLKIFAGVP